MLLWSVDITVRRCYHLLRRCYGKSGTDFFPLRVVPQSIPKKALVRLLADYCSDEAEAVGCYGRLTHTLCAAQY
eukprot:3767392-Rhodomonas_salina.1